MELLLLVLAKVEEHQTEEVCYQLLPMVLVKVFDQSRILSVGVEEQLVQEFYD